LKSNEIIPEIEFSYSFVLNFLSPRFELKNDKFIDETPFYCKDCTPLEIKPTKEQWVEFWKKMDEINIWNWNEYYDPIDCVIMDRIRRIEIILGDCRIMEDENFFHQPFLTTHFYQLHTEQNP